jgi:hypothetical protein
MPFSSAVIFLSRRRGAQRAPARRFFIRVSFHDEGFALRGEFLFPRRKRNQNAAGGASHRRREQVPSGSSSFSPGPPEFTGGPIPGGCRSLSGAGETTTAPATAPLPLPLQNQDGLDSWTKRARLIAQGLISAEENRRAGQETRPSPIHGNGSVRRTPTLTLCHGWSEPGAAVKWCRPKFCADQGPVARKESTPGTVFCAPEILRKGIGVSPVTGGPGVVRLWAGSPIGAHPRRSFGFFPIAGKETRPAGRNPHRGMKPF